MGRTGHTAVLYNGAIYVGGGVNKANQDDDDDDPFTVNIYHPDTNKWDTILTLHMHFLPWPF